MSRPRNCTPKSKPSRAGSPTGGSGAAAAKRSRRNGDEPRKARAVAYVRESTEEQGKGFSPDAQREAIRRFADENELELVDDYCDFHSGWKQADGRPEFQRLMADAAERRFDVVLVYHTSRFARNQSEARRYKALLRDRLGIRVVSVTQPIGDDPSDPSFFLAESIHEMFDEYYSVSLSFWTRTGLREKARQGHLVGSLPWGYVRDRDSGLAVPDRERAELVRELFERYATGHESDRSLAEWLNARGARTAKDRAFGKDTVREMLVNAAYCGYVCGLRSKDRSDPRPARAARQRRALRPRAGDPRLADTRPQAGQAVRGLPAAQAPLLRALRRPHARHARLARRRPPLPLLDPPLLERLRPADHARPSRSRRSSSSGCTTSSPTSRSARTSSTSSAPKRSDSAATTPRAAASCTASSTGSATSTSSAT